MLVLVVSDVSRVIQLSLHIDPSLYTAAENMALSLAHRGVVFALSLPFCDFPFHYV